MPTAIEQEKIREWDAYDTRSRPYPPPVPGIFDAPNINLCINQEWARLWISGVLSRLEYSDVYSERELDAIQEIRKLQVAIADENNQGCQNMPLTVETETIRIEQVTHTASWNTVQTEVVVPIPSGYEKVVISVYGKSTHPTVDYLKAWVNNVQNVLLYRWLRPTSAYANSNLISRFGDNSAPDWSQVDIDLDLADTAHYRVFKASFFADSNAVANQVIGEMGMVYQSTDPVTDLTLYPQNGDFAAPGLIVIKGIKQATVVTSVSQ